MELQTITNNELRNAKERAYKKLPNYKKINIEQLFYKIYAFFLKKFINEYMDDENYIDEYALDILKETSISNKRAFKIIKQSIPKEFKKYLPLFSLIKLYNLSNIHLNNLEHKSSSIVLEGLSSFIFQPKLSNVPLSEKIIIFTNACHINLDSINPKSFSQFTKKFHLKIDLRQLKSINSAVTYISYSENNIHEYKSLASKIYRNQLKKLLEEELSSSLNKLI